VIVSDFVDALIAREGGYVDHPADRGGPTKYGITEQVARAWGYTGDMHDLPIETARAIYVERYWSGPGFQQVSARTSAIAEELLDTGANMGPMVASKMLQRALNALNREATSYPDIPVDGVIGRMTLYALDQFIAARGAAGVTVLLRLLNALQACRYVEIAESRPSQEAFLFGWISNRVS